MTAPVKPITVPGSLGEAWRRIQILEANPAQGDYVFLDEHIVAVDGDPLSFTSITQAYRHLVVELLGRAVSSDDENDLCVTFNGNTGADNYGYAENAVLTGVDVLDKFAHVGDGACILVGYVLPGNTGSASETGRMGSVKIDVPYYSLSPTEKIARWQSGGTDFQDVLATTGAGVMDIETVNGDAVSQVDLAPVGHDWAAGSRASLYGIR